MTLKGAPTMLWEGGLAGPKMQSSWQAMAPNASPFCGKPEKYEEMEGGEEGQRRRKEGKQTRWSVSAAGVRVGSTKVHDLENGSCSHRREEARHTSLHGSGDGL